MLIPENELMISVFEIKDNTDAYLRVCLYPSIREHQRTP